MFIIKRWSGEHQAAEKAFSSLTNLYDASTAELTEIMTDAEIPNRLLQLAYLIDTPAKKLTRVSKTMERHILSHIENGGEVEEGIIRAGLGKNSPRSSVPWKEIATKQAAELAELKGETWNEETWVTRLQAEHRPPEGTPKLILSESI